MGDSGSVAAAWPRALPQLLERVAVVEDAVAALLAGTLGDDARDDSRREAHHAAGEQEPAELVLAGFSGVRAGALLRAASGRDLRAAALPGPPDDTPALLLLDGTLPGLPAIVVGRALRADDAFAAHMARQTLDLPEAVLPA